jgi:hypothetical protein
MVVAPAFRRCRFSKGGQGTRDLVIPLSAAIRRFAIYIMKTENDLTDEKNQLTVLPPDKRMKFFVYIVESPSAVDLYHNRKEGDLLSQVIRLNGIPCASRLAINLEAFIAALRIGLHEEMQVYTDLVPVLHISAHGFSEGIEFSSSEVLTWEQLRHLLNPINKALGGGLLLCMSTCEGYAGSRMAMFLDQDDHPFFAIVGNSEKPSWPETAVGFATFYHLIANGHFIIDSVNAMRIASGNQLFFVTTAEEAKKNYIEHVNNLDLNAAREELQQESQHDPSNDLVKLARVV